MNVVTSDEAAALYDAVNAVLAHHVPPSVVREAWADPDIPCGQVWSHLCGLGLTNLTRSPQDGGGLQLADVMPVLEAAGRRAAPVPLAEIVGSACPVLADEPDARAEQLLDDIEGGAAVVTVQDGWTGWAPWAARSRYVIVMDADDAVVCEPDPGDVDTATSTDPTRLLGRVSRSSQAWTLSQPHAARTLRSHLLVSTASTLNGLSAGALAQAVDYARIREQFNRPIGSFQAVRHRLAAAFARLEFTRRYAYYAAWAVARDLPDAPAAARRAKAVAGDVSVEVSYAAFQVFGGMGYTWASDLHLWLKRMQALDAAYGTSDAHWEALAAQDDDVPGAQ